MHYPYGNNLKLYIEGGSRTEYVTAVLRGFPAGVAIDGGFLSAFMLRRAPGRQPHSSPRTEADAPEFLSGITDGATDGSPVRIRIRNLDPGRYCPDYTDTPRPSHADYPAVVKYGPSVDLRGGGRFSARLTAPLCAAGALCLMYLRDRGIGVCSHVSSLGDVADAGFDPLNVTEELAASLRESSFPVIDKESGRRMAELLRKVREDGDSIGGTAECAVTGLPAGVGEHMFAGAEGRISSAVFGIPAVKGIEFGSGFRLGDMRGSEANDEYAFSGAGRVVTLSNNCGGIAGGMTTGMPLIFRAVFKPIPSVAIPMRTVSLKSGSGTVIRSEGRNDACALPRALPALEAACAIAVADMLLDLPPAAPGLPELRRDISAADSRIASAFAERLEAAEEIGRLKKDSGLPLCDPSREAEVISAARAASAPYGDEAERLYSTVLDISRGIQRRRPPRYTGNSHKRIALIGRRLDHSLSPAVHSLIGDYRYELLPASPDDLGRTLSDGGFDAFNITVPYKRAVIPFLSALSDDAAAAGAVNTVIRGADGSLTGHNTDVDGFMYMFGTVCGGIPSGTRVVVAGNGGAAAAAVLALGKMGFRDVVTVSRSDPGTARFYEIARLCADRPYVLVNATPVGTSPDTGACVFEEETVAGARAVLDMVYNPFRTRLVRLAAAHGVPCSGGLPMLCAQAVAAADLWLGTSSPKELTDSVLAGTASDFASVVLIGMPGCGKSSVGRILAQMTGRPFFDTDADLELRTGLSCRTFLERYGEEAFRKEEHVSCVTASHLRGAVIATGGGAPAYGPDVPVLRSCGTVVWLERDISELPADGRPLSQAGGLAALYERRRPAYEQTADVRIGAKESPALTAALIAQKLGIG